MVQKGIDPRLRWLNDSESWHSVIGRCSKGPWALRQGDQLRCMGEAMRASAGGNGGFTHATERIPLPEGPWPLPAPADDTVPTLGAIEPTQPGVNALLNHGQIVQAKQKDKHAWKTAHDANQAA